MTETKVKTWTIQKQRKAEADWRAKNIRQIKFQFNLENDADVLAKLDNVPNKQDYVRRLIREDIAREQQK